MRPTYAGPASSSSNWRATQDPGTTSPTSNTAGYRSVGMDMNPASLTAANLPQEQQFGYEVVLIIFHSITLINF
ncbi:unnamed protein product [Rotaria sp. Silwood2]|nr:unnamed protein product [Rotaria sp. Silwood2]CAF3137511.1 unnamed protein product [Rotaria sp. Silwood2]